MHRLPTARYPDIAEAMDWGRKVASNIADLKNFPDTTITPMELIGNAIFNFACSQAEILARADRERIIAGKACAACGAEPPVQR